MRDAPVELEYSGAKYIRADTVAEQLQKILDENIKMTKKLKIMEKRVEVERTWVHAFLADIHAGSSRFDIIAYNKVIDIIKRERMRANILHLLGDVVEGKFNHRGQSFEAFPPDLQQEIAVQAIVKMVRALRVKTICIIPGNHDLKYSINLLNTVVEKLGRELQDVEIRYYRDDEFYIFSDVMGLHSVGGGGSIYTAFTGWIEHNLLKGALQYSVWERIKYIGVGHYHVPAVLPYSEKLLIAVPSFQWSKQFGRNERGIVLARRDEVKIVSVRPSRKREIIEYWRKAVKI